MDLINNKTRILFATHTRPKYMPPPVYSESMLICSPYYPNHADENGTIRSIKLPEERAYDLAALIESLPASQQPEVVIIRLDSTFQHIPGNIRAISQPTIALLGDTHHMCQPIQKMLDFLLREKFNHLLIDHNLQHTHWFTEAGIQPIHWLPGTLLSECWIKPQKRPLKQVAFVGQMGKAHPVRNRLLERIQLSGVPLSMQSVPQKLAGRLYNKSAISFNHSLNGDFNLRVFEVLSSGGFLLTERLEPQTGQETLFENGKHLVCYDGPDDLIDKCRYYLSHPKERNRIAAAGHKKIKLHFSIQARLQAFNDLLNNRSQQKWRPDLIDPRNTSYGCHNRTDLIQRITIYEWIQEQHRHFDKLHCRFSPNIDARQICDLTDLPRLELQLSADNKTPELAVTAGIRTDRFTFNEPGSQTICIDLACGRDILNTESRVHDALIVSDWLSLSAAEKTAIKALCESNNLTAANHTDGLFLGNQNWSDVWNRPPHT